MGRPADPAYWSKWRARHPEYVARERERGRARRARGERGDRATEYERRNERRRVLRRAASGRLVEEARDRLRERERREIGDGRYDNGSIDFVSEYVLAVLEGRDPLAALAEVRKRAARDRATLLYGVDGF